MRKVFDSVFFFHMRKSAGTSLRHTLQQYCNKNGKKLEVLEGWSLNSESRFSFKEESFSVICLRNPIDRIKSAYKFEGRWKQQALLRTPETAKPFNTWVEAVSGLKQSNNLWQCVENYYIKSLVGYPDPKMGYRSFGQYIIGESELHTAKAVLKLFDLVLIAEHLSSNETSRLLNHRLGITTPVLNRVFPTAAPSPTETENDLFDSSTLARIFDSNRLDMRLYKFAKAIYTAELSHVV